MKNSRIKISLAARILLIITVITLTALPVLAATYPKPKNNVADEAGVLSESTIRAIETANKTLKLDTGTAIAVCTVDTTGESDIAEYARGVFKEWKLGEGVLLLIAKDDKNYYFVQSVGVESVLTNDVLKSIRDEYLEEDFEAGDINRGVNKCVTKLKNVLTAGIPAASTSANATDTRQIPNLRERQCRQCHSRIFKAVLWIVLIAVVLLVAFFVLAMYNEDAAHCSASTYSASPTTANARGILRRKTLRRSAQKTEPKQTAAGTSSAETPRTRGQIFSG